jgi:hypothetical protein
MSDLKHVEVIKTYRQPLADGLVRRHTEHVSTLRNACNEICS